MSEENLEQRAKQIAEYARTIPDETKRMQYVSEQCKQHPELIESLVRWLVRVGPPLGEPDITAADPPSSDPTPPPSSHSSDYASPITLVSDDSDSSDQPTRGPAGSSGAKASSDPTLVSHENSTEFEVDEEPVIDGFKLMERLGEGGMGAVYVAQQLEPVRRKVAIKIIRTGMANKEVRARFVAERQALAMMDHPNIARIYGGGTTRHGEPYLVMELVHGLPITKYADHYELNLHERLELIIDVCQAIQHAHHKGIIHRDIKPSNILVAQIDGKAVAKVIDFGLAKAIHEDLTDETLYTRFAQMIGTPLYMSPEQAAMGVVDVDTRSDVYSIGVLMYELLTGKTPFDRKTLKEAAFDEMRRIIREQEPRRPSTALSTLEANKLANVAGKRRVEVRKLHEALRGELDWIVMKALEKDRTRRYESPGDLARDIQRHLANEPVRACPPSTIYQLRKTWVRHKVVLTTASLVAASVAFALVVSLWKANEAEEARQLALRRYNAEREARRNLTVERDRANREKRRAQEMLYVADMKHASDALAAADAPRLANLLARHWPDPGEEDLRDFAWHYLHQTIDIPQRWEDDLGSRIWTIAVTPEGDLCAVGTENGTLRIYNALDGNMIKQYDGMEVNSLAWSPDGRQLAAGLGNGFIQLFDVSHDLSLLSAPQGAKKWEPPQTLVLKRGPSIAAHHEAATGVLFSVDGKEIFSSGDEGQIARWDITTGNLKQSYREHQRSVEQMDITPDGRRLASASSDHHVFVWDLESEKVLKRFLSPSRTRFVSLDISSDGRFLAAGDIDGNLLIADLQQFTTRWMRQRDGIESVTFLTDNVTIAAGDRGGSIHLWKIDTDKHEAFDVSPDNRSLWQAHTGRVEALAVANGSNKILSGSRNGVLLCWTPHERNARTFPANNLAIAHDDTVLAAHQAIHRLDRKGNKVIASFAEQLHQWRWIDAAAEAPRAVASTTEGPVTVFDLENNAEIQRWQVEGEISQLKISPDGTRVIVRVHQTDRVYLFEVGRDDPVETLLVIQCSSIAVSPQHDLLAVGSLDNVLLYSLSEPGIPHSLRGHDSTVASMRFHPRERKLASVGNDRRLKLWNLGNYRELRSTNASDHRIIHCLDFSRDGRLLITGGEDGIVHFWHAETFQPLLDIPVGDPIRQVRMAPDQRHLFVIAKGEQYYARVYSAEP